MNAPPSIIQSVGLLKLNELKCFEHQNNPIVGICNDDNCQIKTKYMCLDCMFEKHSGHKGIKSNIIEEIYNQKMKKYLIRNGKIKPEYHNFEEMLRNKINEMKNTISKYLDQFYHNTLEEVKKDKSIYGEINLINQIYPPKNSDQLNKIISELLNLYNNPNNHKETILDEKGFSKYEDLIQKKFISLESYIKEFIKFKIEEEINFEWSTKTYNNYGFYYNLEDDNTRVRKISNGGTISVCRGKLPLKKGNKYKLEYFINYIKGDFDVGFGAEEAGKQDWLRSGYAYCISSNGIYEDTMNNSSVNLLNAKKITFIIDLNHDNVDIFLDEQKSHNFKIRGDLIYYPMVAIRELNNSAKLKLTQLIS